MYLSPQLILTRALLSNDAGRVVTDIVVHQRAGEVSEHKDSREVGEQSPLLCRHSHACPNI